MKLEKLTYQLALLEIKEIEAIKRDDEVAHQKEDDLYFRFIQCVASGMYEANEAQKIAKALKRTKRIDFERWCA